MVGLLGADSVECHGAECALPRQLGDYELVEELGRGGMGVVYRARQLSLNRVVAVKVLPGAIFSDPQSRSRFRTEATAAAALRHPNIVTIHDVGEDDGQPFFAMEFIEGQTLAARVAERHLAATEAAGLVRAIAEAVQFAHENGILHRDLKPSNILLDAEGQPQVADFGLAKRLADEAELTLSGQTLGSPNYIPPEQVSAGHGEVGPATDVYSLGAILYHLLTGRPPVVADTVHDTLAAVLHGDPVPPRRLNPTVPRDLETICLKCLAKESRRRYATARELAEDLGFFLNHLPIRARPTTPAERALKWVRRHPALATSAAVVLTCAGLVIALVSIHNSELRRQRDRALASERLADQTVTKLEFNAALGRFEEDRCLSGLMQLGRLLRREPGHAAAIDRLVSALTYREFNLLAFAPLEHPGEIGDAHFTPDGRRVVSGCADGLVRFWEAESGKLLPFGIQRPQPVVSVNLGPRGGRLLVVEADGTVSFWSPENGRQIGVCITNGVPALLARISSDDELALVAFADRTVRVWRIDTGESVLSAIQHHDTVTVAEFNPAGGTLLTGSRNGRLQSWSLTNGQPVGAVIETFRPLNAAGFNPDGSRFATASGDPSALIWESATGRLLKKLDARAAANTAIAFSPDGHRLASGTMDGTWTVSDVAGRQRLSRIADAPGRISGLVFSPDGERLLVIARDQSVQLFDSQHGSVMSEPIPHASPIARAEFSPDGTRVLIASGTNLCVWEVVRNLKPEFVIPSARSVQAVCYSPDGRVLLAGGEDGTARLFDATTGRPVGVPMAHIPDISFRSLRFSPDGRKVATASADHTARVWDANTGTPLTPWLRHKDMVLHAEFDARSERLVTASADDSAVIWNLVAGTDEVAALPHPDDVLWAGFAPDQSRVVTGCRDGRVRLWDATSGKLLNLGVTHDDAVSVSRFSPDGRWFLTGAGDGSAVLADTQSFRPVAPRFWQSAPVTALDFSTESQLFLAAAVDGGIQLRTLGSGALSATVKFKRALTAAYFLPGGRFGLAVVNREFVAPWSLEAGASAGEWWRHWGTVNALAISPDGRFAATGGGPGAGIRIRELPPGTVPAPPWLPDLAEALAGGSVDERGEVRRIPPGELWQLQVRLRNLPGEDEWSRWGRWFADAAADHRVLPSLAVTRLELADTCYRDSSYLLHREAAWWAADQPRALARLALDLPALINRSRLRAEADLLTRLAVLRAPDDPEVRRLRGEVEAILARFNKPE